MAKRKRNDLSDGKKQIIAGLLNEYDIKTELADDNESIIAELYSS